MSKIRIHQDSGDLYVNVISVNSRYVDFIIHNDLSIDMKVPVGMSREMIELVLSSISFSKGFR